MTIEEFDATDVQSIALGEEKEKKAPVYDLSGRKLKEPHKGISIIGGRKVLR